MITSATAADEAALKNLLTEAFEPLRRTYVVSGRIPSLSAEPTTLVYAADDRPVGTLSYYLDPPYVRLFRIAVAPEYRGRGIASRLIDYVETRVARPAGCDLAIYTITETGNVAIFRRLGFEPIAETVAACATSPDGKPVHETEMVRPARAGGTGTFQAELSQ